MEPALKHYIIVYSCIVIPLALSFLFIRRGSKPPVQLRLKDDTPPPAPQATLPPKQAFQPAGGNAQRKQEPYPRPRPSGESPPQPPREKALNALFQWNGHSWDAYEVLGVPAGSSIDTVTTALNRALKGCDEESMQFFKAAYDAIMRAR